MRSTSALKTSTCNGARPSCGLARDGRTAPQHCRRLSPSRCANTSMRGVNSITATWRLVEPSSLYPTPWSGNCPPPAGNCLRRLSPLRPVLVPDAGSGRLVCYHASPATLQRAVRLAGLAARPNSASPPPPGSAAWPTGRAPARPAAPPASATWPTGHVPARPPAPLSAPRSGSRRPPASRARPASPADLQPDTQPSSRAPTGQPAPTASARPQLSKLPRAHGPGSASSIRSAAFRQANFTLAPARATMAIGGPTERKAERKQVRSVRQCPYLRVGADPPGRRECGAREAPDRPASEPVLQLQPRHRADREQPDSGVHSRAQPDHTRGAGLSPLRSARSEAPRPRGSRAGVATGLRASVVRSPVAHGCLVVGRCSQQGPTHTGFRAA